MQENQSPSSGRRKNLLIIIAFAVLAATLLLISRVISPPDATRGQDEINTQIAALSTQTPKGGSQEASPAQAQAYLYIILNNRLWGIEPLGEEREVTVDQGGGVVNVIHLLPDGFYMASSTCDNQLCVSEGTVTVDNYQRRILGTSVLCLPHHLDLELVVPSHTPDPNAPDI